MARLLWLSALLHLRDVMLHVECIAIQIGDVDVRSARYYRPCGFCSWSVKETLLYNGTTYTLGRTLNEATEIAEEQVRLNAV